MAIIRPRPSIKRPRVKVCTLEAFLTDREGVCVSITQSYLAAGTGADGGSSVRSSLPCSVYVSDNMGGRNSTSSVVTSTMIASGCGI